MDGRDEQVQVHVADELYHLTESGTSIDEDDRQMILCATGEATFVKIGPARDIREL